MIRILGIILLLGSYVCSSYGQAVFHKNDYTSAYILDGQNNNGFEVSASLVVVFTKGVADRNGFRLGVGLSMSKVIHRWRCTMGADSYKANQSFGLGITYAGIMYNIRNLGASYYVTKYYQGDQQVSGIVGGRFKDFEFKFEDDILSLPFTAFRIYDRYRTAAIELKYKHFLIGTNVYTTEPDGLMDFCVKNKNGIYKNGYKVSSPFYIGYTNKELMFRYGINSSFGGYVGQDFWHRLFFDTGEFKNGDYKNTFIQLGTYKPYTLY